MDAVPPADAASMGFGLAFADHVQPARVAGLDLDRDLEVHEAHQLLEDRLAGGERLR